MIKETPVLVPSNDEDAALPNYRIANGFVCRIDQTFAKSDIIEWMLRCASFVVVQQRIARFDKHIVVGKGPLQVGRKFFVGADVVQVNTL